MKTMMMLLAFVPVVAFAQSVVVNSYTFTGRVMDARHTGFDDKRKATISARDLSARLLARANTFFLEDSRRNYSLHVPMASGNADGYASLGSPLEIEVKDDAGTVWRGLVADSVAGAPGKVREVDIVLATDENRDGIADELFSQLRDEWEDSDYWVWGETFDPTKDYDGDGVSTINEALSGTDPFNPDEVLKITGFSHDASSGTVTLSFVGIEGHSYVIETATSLGDKDWKGGEFRLPDSTGNSTSISFLTGTRSTPTTVYLTPSSGNFFRVKAQ